MRYSVGVGSVSNDKQAENTVRIASVGVGPSTVPLRGVYGRAWLRPGFRTDRGGVRSKSSQSEILEFWDAVDGSVDVFSELRDETSGARPQAREPLVSERERYIDGSAPLFFENRF